MREDTKYPKSTRYDEEWNKFLNFREAIRSTEIIRSDTWKTIFTEWRRMNKILATERFSINLCNF